MSPRLAAELVALALAAVAIGWLWAEKAGVEVLLAQEQRDRSADHARAAEAAASATQAARVEERRDAAKTVRVLDDERTKAMAEAVDARSAAAAADGLRRSAARAAAACRGPAPAAATAAASGPPAADSGLLLADVLGRLGEAHAALALEADRRGRAGAACEALSP